MTITPYSDLSQNAFIDTSGMTPVPGAPGAFFNSQGNIVYSGQITPGTASTVRSQFDSSTPDEQNAFTSTFQNPGGMGVSPGSSAYSNDDYVGTGSGLNEKNAGSALSNLLQLAGVASAFASPFVFGGTGALGDAGSEISGSSGADALTGSSGSDALASTPSASSFENIGSNAFGQIPVSSFNTPGFSPTTAGLPSIAPAVTTAAADSGAAASSGGIGDLISKLFSPGATTGGKQAAPAIIQGLGGLLNIAQAVKGTQSPSQKDILAQQANLNNQQNQYASNLITAINNASLPRTQTHPNIDYSHGAESATPLYFDNVNPKVTYPNIIPTTTYAHGGKVEEKAIGGLARIGRIPVPNSQGASIRSTPNFARPPMKSAGMAPVSYGARHPNQMAEGGSMNAGALGNFVSGSSGGQADDVNAKLSSGEYVFPADVVSHLGDGNNEAGAKKLDMAISKIRKHKTGNNKFPPKAKNPGSYIGGGQ